jgi:hypothetical protein
VDCCLFWVVTPSQETHKTTIGISFIKEYILQPVIITFTYLHVNAYCRAQETTKLTSRRHIIKLLCRPIFSNKVGCTRVLAILLSFLSVTKKSAETAIN